MDALTVIPPESHDRAKFLGGSDIAAVIGVSPWKTAFDLWRDKTTPRVEGGDNPRGAKRRGIRWESVVAEMLVEDLIARGHRVEVLNTNRRYRDEVHSMFASEIDFEVRLDDDEDVTNVELKTVHPFKVREWGESGTDELPLHYLAQVQWGLGITKRRRGILAALFGADELRTYPVAADDATITALRVRALAFWQQHVLTGVAPEPTNLADLAKLFPTESKDGPPLLADEDLVAKVLRLRACRDEIGARESEAEAIEFEIRRAMRDASEIILPNGKTPVEWKTRSGTYVDETALKEAHPKLHKEYSRKWERRVFRLKAFDMKGL